ncbi:MAG: malto-oligosyltrehalose synthase [Arachnia sp.]
MSDSPASTYRIQFNSGFTYDDAVARVPYLANLGVTHIFCSPILQATPGSMHGYDVIDHSRISQDCGGEAGFRRLADAAHDHGMGIIVDVVPNHMAVPTPLWQNRALWDVLREGPDSRFAHWFDIDISHQHKILMPVLGERIGEELAAGTISVQRRATGSDPEAAREPVVVYFDHVFPVRPGTEDLPIEELLDQQWYRLAYWRVGSEELNYRRFFDVDTLAAVRVEDESVFEATHSTYLQLQREGLIDGYRIDHPDGLANPRAYLEDLRRATDDAWVVVEKILEADEHLPESFACAGTTGYDALMRVAGVFADPASSARLNVVWERLSGSAESFWGALMSATDQVVATMLFTEVNRLTSIAVAICDADIRLRDYTRRQLQRSITELLVHMDRYRVYVEPGQPVTHADRTLINESAERARERLDEHELEALDLVVALACGETGAGGPAGDGAERLPAPGAPGVTTELPGQLRPEADLRAEFMIRFAQTCGPVMAKSKEDTTFYRWNRFVGVNEVGSEPTVLGISPDTFHDFARVLNEQWPTTMTTLSTHDTKRSEDVRARLCALLEHPKAWETCVHDVRQATSEHRKDLVDGATEYLLWQTMAACWEFPGTDAGQRPIVASRLLPYLTKAIREAKLHTDWTEVNQPYEEAVLALAKQALADETVVAAFDVFRRVSDASARVVLLGQKLLQLTMPGVPDLYQGCEIVDLSLVDPDNRRQVDFDLRERLLAHVDQAAPRTVDEEKLLVVSRALRLRRDRPDAFRGPRATYAPVPTTSGHAVAFARGVKGSDAPSAITVVTRLPQALADRGGWGDHTVILPPGTWRNLLTGASHNGGELRLSELLETLPVALLTGA